MSSGLSDIVSFFDSQAASNDVTGALGTASMAFKVAMFVIMFIGAIAMAIFIVRIAFDILAIVLRGTNVGSKLEKFGTGKVSESGTVSAYFKSNIVEIILVIILIVFLMTGFLFRLIAMALSGFGMVANKLLGLDIQGGLSSLNIDAYTQGVEAMRPATAKNEYDTQVGIARAELENLYNLSKKGASVESSRDYEKFNKSKSIYTNALGKAGIVAKELKGDASKQFKLPSEYFEKHTRTTGEGVCNSNFFEPAVVSQYGSIKCAK